MSLLVPRCHHLAPCRIHSLPSSYHYNHVDFPSQHTSKDNFRCFKCFQEHCPYHFHLDGGRFCSFGSHLIQAFFLQGDCLQTNLVAEVIF